MSQLFAKVISPSQRLELTDPLSVRQKFLNPPPDKPAPPLQKGGQIRFLISILILLYALAFGKMARRCAMASAAVISGTYRKRVFVYFRVFFYKKVYVIAEIFNSFAASNRPTFKQLIMKILIINGPNLNLLGVRERSIYGDESMETYFSSLCERYPEIEMAYYQSNIEGELINKIHEQGFDVHGIVLNAGAYTHTSVALADAISAIKAPVIEVHISNTAKREVFRHTSYISAACLGTIAGFGMDSYRLAVDALTKI